jgi:hypothetical protein
MTVLTVRPPEILDDRTCRVRSLREGAVAPPQVLAECPTELLQLRKASVHLFEFAVEQLLHLAT